MSRRSTNISVALIAVVAAVALFVGTHWFLGHPRRKHRRTESNSMRMASLIGDYMERHGTPPYSPRNSYGEYVHAISENVRGRPTTTTNPAIAAKARYLVFVNLTPKEWEALAAARQREPAEKYALVVGWMGKRIAKRLDDVVILELVESEFGGPPLNMQPVAMRWGEYSVPRLQRFDALIRRTLGKPLADCVVCEEGDFDPSLLGLEEAGDDTAVSHEPERVP